MKAKLRILLFILLLTAVCGTVVSGLHAGLKGKIALNEKVAGERLILGLLKTEGIETAAPEAVDKQFAALIEEVTIDAPDGGYRFYRPRQGDRAVLIIPLQGMGFWDRIEGYLVINTATMALHGIAFAKQSETPGLGARIEEPFWRKQFDALPCGAVSADGRRLRIVPPNTADPQQQEVDAITGATETSRAMEKILNQSIERFLHLQPVLTSGGQL